MSRSLKKGPYVDPRVIKKLEGRTLGDKTVIKTWSRACSISPEMVGHKLGEFSPTRKFQRHGGKIQKEMDSASKQREVDANKAAKTSTAGVGKKK